MSSGPVISNASPLIALEQIGHLDLLKGLFSAVLIPPAVVREIAPTVDIACMSQRTCPHSADRPSDTSCHARARGDEAMSPALEIGAQWVILDERPARRLA
jgi:predicted nucleic acid-binding protein